MASREREHCKFGAASPVGASDSWRCRSWLVRTIDTCRATRTALIVVVLSAWGCTQNLTAIESTNASATGGSGSASCINASCNFADTSGAQCCYGARCNSLNVCVAVDTGTYPSSDAGYSAGPGQACTGESSCMFGFRCQTIGDYRVCVPSEDLALGDGRTCQISSDCSSLNCDSSSHCALGTPCRARGELCLVDKDCCSNRCVGGKCGSGDCSVYGDSCYRDTECCTQPSGMTSCVWLGSVIGSRCLASTCRHQWDACTSSNQCCRGQCISNRCQMGTEPCLTHGQYCSDGLDECCSTLCSRGTSYQWSCGKLDGCQPEGESCSDDSVCCSKKCADDHCVRSTSGADNCLSEGEACLGLCCYQMSCSSDWFTALRCSSVTLTSSCRQTGEACAFGAQCCNGARCEQDSTGAFTCLKYPY